MAESSGNTANTVRSGKALGETQKPKHFQSRRQSNWPSALGKPNMKQNTRDYQTSGDSQLTGKERAPRGGTSSNNELASARGLSNLALVFCAPSIFAINSAVVSLIGAIVFPETCRLPSFLFGSTCSAKCASRGRWRQCRPPRAGQGHLVFSRGSYTER